MGSRASDSPRALIAEALLAIIVDGKSLDASLDGVRERNTKPTTSAFIQNSVYAVTRRYFELDALLQRLMVRPVRNRDLVLKMLLLAGLNELMFLNTAAYAVVDESVAACAALERPWAKGLVNGILRAATRMNSAPGSQPASLEVQWNHPTWLINAISSDWCDFTHQVLAANNSHPPLVLRVNQTRTTREQFLERLTNAAVAAHPTKYAPSGVMISHPCPVADLPGFSDGLFSVQDEAAQLAAPLLNCLPSHRVLDACAAPGGKTTHLLELNPALALTAVEINQSRLVDIEENLARLGLKCSVRHLDACTLGADYPAPQYDRILLDAPCSAVGVIRRHPDIKLHRTPDDLKHAIARQTQLLDSLWPLLAPKGELLYATCSILHTENDSVIERFVTTHVDSAESLSIAADWGHLTNFGRQILPGEGDMDGFYYARLKKRSAIDLSS